MTSGNNGESLYTPPAFHPKALRLIFIWQVSGLFPVTAFPSACGGTVACSCKLFPDVRDETHSYGDSAGITLGLPF